jgi:hypothetical protein
MIICFLQGFFYCFFFFVSFVYNNVSGFPQDRDDRDELPHRYLGLEIRSWHN